MPAVKKTPFLSMGFFTRTRQPVSVSTGASSLSGAVGRGEGTMPGKGDEECRPRAGWPSCPPILPGRHRDAKACFIPAYPVALPWSRADLRALIRKTPLLPQPKRASLCLLLVLVPAVGVFVLEKAMSAGPGGATLIRGWERIQMYYAGCSFISRTRLMVSASWFREAGFMTNSLMPNSLAVSRFTISL